MTFGTRVTVILSVFGLALGCWAVGGVSGAMTAVVVGSLVGFVPLHCRTPASWLLLWARRRERIELTAPRTLANDRSGGGVRYQDGFAAAAIHVLGTEHSTTLLRGNTASSEGTVLCINDLIPLLDQGLGLRIHSLSVVTTGARRRESGDYPRVYDTLIGAVPYAGRRETWLIVRVHALGNAEPLSRRASLGSATLAATQRIAASLRERGIRSRVATAAEITELDRRLGIASVEPARRQWNSVSSGRCWLTTYAYPPEDLSTEGLARIWSAHLDGLIQNITLFADRTATATVTTLTAQPPADHPSLGLRSLPGEQARAVAANLCGPLPKLAGVKRANLVHVVTIPMGPSGVLVGSVGPGERLVLPFSDPTELSRVHLAAEDSLVKRLLIRLAASGERVTVHTLDSRRWSRIRLPDVTVTEWDKPIPGTTIGVVDGTVVLAPRPDTLITVDRCGSAPDGAADIVISQIGPATVSVVVGDRHYQVEMELFRAENRYAVSEEIAS